VAGRKDAILPRKRFNFREDMTLRVQQQTHASLAGLEIANIGSQDSVDVSLAVRASEGKESSKIRVHEDHCLAQGRILLGEVPKAGRQERAKIFAQYRPGGSVQAKQWSFQRHDRM
jgi:hypothetical protein